MMNPTEIKNYIERTDVAIRNFEADVLECQSTTFPEGFPFEDFFAFAHRWRLFKSENDGYFSNAVDSLIQSVGRNSQVVLDTDMFNMSLITYRNRFLLACGRPARGDVPRMSGLEDSIDDGRRIEQFESNIVGGGIEIGKVAMGVGIFALIAYTITRK